MTKKRQPDDKEQSDRFMEAARLVGADESGTLFEEAAERLLRPKSATEKKAEANK